MADQLAEALKEFPLVTFEVQRHLNTELHLHGSYLELVIITDGSGQHLLENGSFALAPGDVFVIPVNVLHGYAACRSLGLINILFDPRRLELPEHQLSRLPGYSALFTYEPRLRREHQFASRLRVDEEVLARLRVSLQGIRQELLSKKQGFEPACTAHLCHVLLELSRHYSTMAEPMSETLVKLSDLLRWLDQNFEKPLTLDELAERAKMSRSTLTRSFRQCFGLSPMNYVIGLRIRRAERLLKSTNALVKEVAAQVGIDDTSYFSRLFKQHTGFDPSAYRAEHGSAPPNGATDRT